MATKKTTKKDRTELLVRANQEINKILDNGLTNGEADTVLAALWAETWYPSGKEISNLAAIRFFGKCIKALDLIKDVTDEEEFMTAFVKEYTKDE